MDSMVAKVELAVVVKEMGAKRLPAVPTKGASSASFAEVMQGVADAPAAAGKSSQRADVKRGTAELPMVATKSPSHVMTVQKSEGVPVSAAVPKIQPASTVDAVVAKDEVPIKAAAVGGDPEPVSETSVAAPVATAVANAPLLLLTETKPTAAQVGVKKDVETVRDVGVVSAPKKSEATHASKAEVVAADVAAVPVVASGTIVASPTLALTAVVPSTKRKRDDLDVRVVTAKGDAPTTIVKDVPATTEPKLASALLQPVLSSAMPKAVEDVGAHSGFEAHATAGVVSDVAAKVALPGLAMRVESRAAAPAVVRDVRRVEVGASVLQLQSYEAATPNRLEVGLRGGSYGWVNVRAEMSGDGGVHALLRGPAETVTVLQGHAAELTNYLREQSVTAQVSVESARGGMAQSLSDAGGGQQEKRRDESVPQGREASVDVEESAIVSVPLGVVAQSGTALASTGGWLSVRV